MKPWQRWLSGIALALVLAVGFAGYLSPGMRISWESVAALCGF